MMFVRHRVAVAFAILIVSPSVLADPPPDAAAIKKAWRKHCTDCHGDDGKGKPVKAKMLKVEPRLLDLTRAENFTRSRDEMRKILVEGKDAMPSFKSKLKPPMVDALLQVSMDIVAKAKAGKAPPASTKPPPTKTP